MGSIEDANNIFNAWQEHLGDYQELVVEARNTYIAGTGLIEEITATYNSLRNLVGQYVDVLEQHDAAMDDAGKLFGEVCTAVQQSGMPEQPPYTDFFRHLLAAHHFHKELGAKTNSMEAIVAKEQLDKLNGPLSVLGTRAEKVEDSSLGALREVEGAVQMIETFKKDI